MKPLFLLAAFTFMSFFTNAQDLSSDPVLMKINGQEIRKSEFEYIYQKNTQQQVEQKKSLSDYVDLFVNFKLKVIEAETQGLDTTQSFISELNGYRNQLAKPYLVDQKVDNDLLHEAYNHLLENVEVSHILFRLDPNESEDKANKVLQRANECRAKLLAGADFAKMAKQVSEDPSAQQNNGYLGYISAFMTVYPFEKGAYDTPVGSISEPVRSNFGYHLIKVHNRRPDQGEVLAAHIMKMVPKNSNPKMQEKAKKEIDSIYNKLQDGADFEDMARKLSDDQGSATQGGRLPWFGTGRMVPEFEHAVFSLSQKNSITKPFRTAYGWHIAKLLDKRSVGSFESQKADIQKKLMYDDRANKSKQALIDTLKRQYQFTVFPAVEQKLFDLAKTISPLDSAYIAQIRQYEGPLFSLANHVYTCADFSNYLKSNAFSNFHEKDAILKDKMSNYVKYIILAYENTQLEKKYADFRNLIREYHDGILLFDISNKLVWDKASSDDKGLANYFSKHKKSYKWKQPRFKGLLLECSNDSVEQIARNLIKQNSSDSIVDVLKRTLNSSEKSNLKVQQGVFAKGDNPNIDALFFNDGEVVKTNSYPTVFISGKSLKKRPENYNDVRGLVTSDYQDYLEKEWVKQLRKKYVVEINKDVLKTVKTL